MTLSMLVMSAVLSGFLFVGRNFGRLANQQTLESEGRRTLAYFEQDVRKATAISTPLVTEVTLTVPTGTGTTSIRYNYDAGAGTITRTAGGTALVLQRNLLSAYFRYYDGQGSPFDNSTAPYTTYTSYTSSIKQVSLNFSSQTGSLNNGTRTPVNHVASSRLLLRNKALTE